MKIEISNGELIDKLTILEIKLQNSINTEQKNNLQKEYIYLKKESELLLTNTIIYQLHKELQKINLELWNIEDSIRAKEKIKKFDQEFIRLARQVYITNDKRALVKKEINILSNSNFIEEKLYEKY